MKETYDELRRPSRAADLHLFDLPTQAEEHYWGMPSCSNEDCTPTRSIKINFFTDHDAKEFAAKLGVNISQKTDSIWYPQQKPLTGTIYYDGPKTRQRYPICIPSKGRADIATTPKLLDALGAWYNIFVEPQEYESYKQRYGENKVVCLPFANLGQGSIPARNYIWDWTNKRGYTKHWVIDDNITVFSRYNLNRRLAVRGGGYFNAMEDFADRYENIAFAGPHDQGFVVDREKQQPLHFNSRVYSCTLIANDLPYRWRGKYNEDTDICLRALKDGYCTVLFRSLLMNKAPTSGGLNRTGTPGGNTENVYTRNDYRAAFVDSLIEQHPDCVTKTWKYGRWHHSVDYSAFENNKPILKTNVTPIPVDNDYGMRLTKNVST